MFGFLSKDNKDKQSADLSNDYMQEFNCDNHMLKYKSCLKSWLPYNKRKCDIHIDEFQYCMVSLNTN